MAHTFHHGKHGRENWVNRLTRREAYRDRDTPRAENGKHLVAKMTRTAVRTRLRNITAGKDADGVVFPVEIRNSWDDRPNID